MSLILLLLPEVDKLHIYTFNVPRMHEYIHKFQNFDDTRGTGMGLHISIFCSIGVGEGGRSSGLSRVGPKFGPLAPPPHPQPHPNSLSFASPHTLPHTIFEKTSYAYVLYCGRKVSGMPFFVDKLSEVLFTMYITLN